MAKQLEALIAEMKAAAELIADGYRCEFEVIHDPENGVARLGCLDDDGELSSFVEVSVSNYSGDERHDAELADFFVKSHPANVLALIAALELAQQQKAKDFEIKARLCNESNSLHDRLKAAERRIAELEASPLAVKLPAHKYRECVNGLLEEAIAYSGTQQLRSRLSARLSNFVKPDHAAGGTVSEGE